MEGQRALQAELSLSKRALELERDERGSLQRKLSENLAACDRQLESFCPEAQLESFGSH